MSIYPNFEWLYRQGIRVSDKLASENWLKESQIVFLLTKTFKDFTIAILRFTDPAGMTEEEKEEARRDHVEGDDA